MAATKEALVIVLDVGASMAAEHNRANFACCLKAVTLLVQQKILFAPKDHVALVLVGTPGSQNALHRETGDYAHVTVLHDCLPPSIDLVRQLDALEPAPAQNADFVDAIIVAMDLLITTTVKGNWDKRIFLVTDAGCPVVEDDLAGVLSKFNAMGAKLNIIGVDFVNIEDSTADSGSNSSSSSNNISNSNSSSRLSRQGSAIIRSPVKAHNEKLLHRIAEHVGGRVLPVHEALAIMSYFRAKSVLQRSSFRGSLDLGENLQIAIWTFVKTTEQKFPAIKKLSTIAEQSPNRASMKVKMERAYVNATDPDMVIEDADRVKGFKYGRNTVPFSNVDERQLKYTSDKCLKVIGFAARSSIRRHHFMKSVEMVVPDPWEDDFAQVGLSALVQAMTETDMVAIARYVKKANGNALLAVLTPSLKPGHARLFLNILPFVEDLREYFFAPLAPDRIRKQYAPSTEQLDAAERLINSLDLMEAAVDEDGNRHEALKPKYTYNPVLQHFYQCVQQRALRPGCKLPVLDPLIQAYVNPDKELFGKAEAALCAFRGQFALERVVHQEKKRGWKDAFADGAAISFDSFELGDGTTPKKVALAPRDSLDAAASDAQKLLPPPPPKLSLESLLAVEVSKVGAINPAGDFMAMLCRRDADCVQTAVTQLQQHILALIDDSVQMVNYPKALECLAALRRGCIQELESATFNEFLRQLRQTLEGGRRDAMWLLIARSGVTLVSSDDAADSDVSPAFAKQFLQKPQAPDDLNASFLRSALAPASRAELDDADADDLLGMVE